MAKSMIWIALAALLAFAGCSSTPDHPAEAEVVGILIGTYCSDEYRNRLEIKPEGRYMSKRSKKSPFGNPITEKCEGNYSLVYNEDNNAWTLNFADSDKSSNPFVKCKASSIEIWKGEAGYVVGKGPVKLVEPFDQQVVQTDKCGDL
jgi:hypothetical protein